MNEKPDWNDLLDLIARFDDGEYENVSVQFGDVALRMSRTGSLDEPGPSTPAATPEALIPRDVEAPPAASPASSGPAITSPMIGVFYRKSSPGSPPFVEVGQEVTPETTIGIIEIMKLMNPVKAGIAGVIREFVVADGEAVEFGQVLARLDAGSS
jgi:acetyl-CoA carboxylase biotin carboxyl carrier protein